MVSVLVAALAMPSCRRREEWHPPKKPEEAGERAAAAARGRQLDRLFRLLDKNSRWSLMSVHKAHREICKLVRGHYPKARQPRELRRCHPAERARDVEAFFVDYFKRHPELLEPLTRFRPPGKRAGSKDPPPRSPAPDRVELVSGAQRLAVCQGDGAWWYCGLREAFDELKLKATRDLTTVRENIESFR
jgi:hypothetical protein